LASLGVSPVASTRLDGAEIQLKKAKAATRVRTPRTPMIASCCPLKDRM
jgi:hypothetical protein